MRKRQLGRFRTVLGFEALEDRTLLSGVVTAVENPLTGVLNITGDGGNNAITIRPVAPDVLRISGDITIPAPPGHPDATSVNGVNYHDFTLSTISAINILLLNGTDKVTMKGFSIPGNITINAGSGVDTFTLDSIVTNAGIISITATGGSTDTITETNVVAGESRITTGSGPATITQTNVTFGLDFITTGAGSDKINIVDSRVAPPPRTYAIGFLSIDSGNGNDNINLKNILVGPATVVAGTGNNTIKFDGSTIQQADITTGLEAPGSQGSNTVDVSNDIITGAFLNVRVLNQSGVSGVLANGSPGIPLTTSVVNTVTMNNVQFTGGGDLNLRVDDGSSYFNAGNNTNIAASTVVMTLIDTTGNVTVTVGDNFALVEVGQGTPGLNDIDANNLTVSAGNNLDVVIVSALLTGGLTVNLGNVTPNPPPQPAMVLINGTSAQADITIGSNTNTGLANGWPITINETVKGHDAYTGDLTITGGDGLALDVTNTTASGNIFINLGSGGINNLESVNLLTVTSTDLSIILDSAATDTPDGSPFGVYITLNNVNVIDTTPKFPLLGPSIPLANFLLEDNGFGTDIVTLTNLNVVYGLDVVLSTSTSGNVLLAQNVTTAFGTIDGGAGPSNIYVDRGGDYGYYVVDFAGRIAGPYPPQLNASNLSLSAATISQGDSVAVSGTFSQPGDADSHTITINWGDGTASTQLQLPSGVFTFTTTHQYVNETPGGTPPDVDTITVTVTNSAGDKASATTSVTVKDVPPAIPAGGLQLNSPAVTVGTPVALTGTFVDPDASTTHQVTIDWGDGSATTTLNLGAGVLTFGPVNHTYQQNLPANAPYTIQVTITDEDNASGSATTQVAVNALPPTLTISGAARVDEGSPYTLDLRSQQSGGGPIASWTITWGDGSVETVAGDPGSVTHTYADGPNSYTILAQATDPQGTYDAANSVVVQVSDVAPTLTVSGATAANPLSPYTLNLASSDPGMDVVTSWSINWGDGTTEPVAGNPSSVTHTYALIHRAYTISAQATNKDGTFAANTLTVTMSFSTANENYIAQVYLDLLGRPVDLSGLEAWTNHLLAGASRAQVMQWIMSSLEYRTLRVDQLYQEYLRRPADPQGLRDDVLALSAGTATDQLKASILGSDEYFALQANGSLTGFFAGLYYDVLHRSGSPGEIQARVQGTPLDASRTALASQFIGSTEADEVLVQNFYQKYLHRSADSSGLTSLVQERQNGASEETIIATFLASDEYFNRAVN